MAGVRRKGGRIYFVATVVAQVSALLRYVILARILGPQELGLAATLTVTSAFFDMISDTGSDRFLIQDRDGDTPRVQGLVQLVYLGRGLITAAALVVFAYPIALIYHTPRLAGGLALLAIPALINGFLHLDIRRVQREHDFRAQGVGMVISEVGALVATGLAAWLTHHFTAIIFGLVTRAILMTALSHIQSKRGYLLKWDPQAARRLAAFAAPLTINGLLLFVVSQSDRVIVGNQIGITALGRYSAIMLLIYYPTTTISNYVHAIYIPIIAAQRDDAPVRAEVSDGLGGLTLLMGVAMMIGFAVITPTLAPLIFGHRFAQPALLVGLVGMLQIARFMLLWPTTVALAIGRSRTVLFSNMAHLVAIATAFLGLRLIGGLEGVVVGFFAGEVVAILVALNLLNRDMDATPMRGFDRWAEFMIACGTVVGWNLALANRSWPESGAMLAVSFGALFWLGKREAPAFKEIGSMGERLFKATLGGRDAAA